MSRESDEGAPGVVDMAKGPQLIEVRSALSGEVAMLIRSTVLTGLLLGISVIVSAQGTGLSLTYAKSSQIGYDVCVTNRNTVPATAFLIVSECSNDNVPGHTNRSYHIHDAVDQWLIDKPLQTGQTTCVNMAPSGLPGDEVSEIRLLATVFSNGTTEGETNWIRQFVNRRKRVYQDLLEALTILRKGLGDSMGPRSMLENFRGLQGREPETFPSGIPGYFGRIPSQKVRNLVIANLEANLRPSENQADFERSIRPFLTHLESWLLHLQLSEPEL